MTADPAYRPGVGIVLINADRTVFAGRRIDMPAGLEAWQMPQGGIDPGETPRQAAMRELCEETGTGKAEILAESAVWHSYDLPVEIAGRMWDGRFRGQQQRWFAMSFLGTDGDINIDTKHPEFDAWQWVVPEELPGLIVPFKRAIYLAVLDEFRDFLTR
jgi:putative (di)nucleoside polyphosphate hydrolase